MQHFAEGPCLFARRVWLSPSAIRVIATFWALFAPITSFAGGDSHAHCLYPPVSYPRSRCAEPWMGLSLRDWYFALVIRTSILGISPPATSKPGDLQYRPLATSRPVSVGPKGRKPRAKARPSATSAYLVRARGAERRSRHQPTGRAGYFGAKRENTDGGANLSFLAKMNRV